MPLNPTGSEIPRSLTQIGTTIDVALDGKADFVRVTDNPSTATAVSFYAVSGLLSYDGEPISATETLDFVSENLWVNQSNTNSLSVESGKWRLVYGDPLPQGTWNSVQTIATRPENCTWVATDLEEGTPVVTFTRATVATLGQFALADDGIYDPVMWQNLGDDVTPQWVPLTTATALSAHTSATGNVHGLTAANVRSILAVSTLSGSNTGDQTLPTRTSLSINNVDNTSDVNKPVSTAQQTALNLLVTQDDYESGIGIDAGQWADELGLASYATTSAVAAGFVPRITSVDNRLTRFDGTTGAVQGTGIAVDDSDNVSGVGNLTTSGTVLLASGSHGAPSLAFSSMPTAGFRGSGGIIVVDLPGVGSGGILQFRSNGIQGGATSSALMRTATATSATVPTLCPSHGDDNTGVGGNNADELYLITGGVSRVTANSSGATVTGNLTASGTVSVPGATFFAGGGHSLGPSLWGNSAEVTSSGARLGAAASVGFTSGTFVHVTSNDATISRQSAGVLQVGTTANNALGSLALTNLTASGTLRIGGGTVVANILSATATLDFPSIGSNGTETLTITVTGAVAGDSVFLGCPAGLDAGLIFCASVTAADTVTVRMHNSSGGSIDPASATFRATVIRF